MAEILKKTTAKKLKKLGKRFVSGTLALATAVTAMTSVLPEITTNITVEALNTTNASSPSYQNKTTKALLGVFGTLYSSSSTSEYEGLLSSTSSDNSNFYKSYGSNFVDGYNFTMSNFSTKTQTLSINGSSYTGTSSYRAIYKARENAYVAKLTDCYTNSFSADKNSSYVGTVGDYTDNGYAYGILLKDETYNAGSKATNDKISYKYEKVGTYTNSSGKSYDIDVELTVDDYAVSDDYVALGANSQRQDEYAMITSSEYSSLTSSQKALCVKLSDSQKSRAKSLWGKTYSYAVPLYNYTAFTNAGGWSKLGHNNHYSTAYGALLSFSTNKVGVNVEWVDWIKITYTFYNHDTGNVLTVKGQAVWKDIDYSQGVSFLNSQVTSGKITPYAWTSASNFNISSFKYYNNSGTAYTYLGYFDGEYRGTSPSDTEAWAAAKFNTNSFTMIYSFAGRFKGNTNAEGTTNLAVHSLSGGTIQSDIAEFDTTGRILITKKFTVNNGAAEHTTSDAVENGLVSTSTSTSGSYTRTYIKDMYYYIKTANGEYVTATKSTSNQYGYVYSGTTTDSSKATKFYLTLVSSDYKVVLTGAPNTTSYYTIENFTSSASDYMTVTSNTITNKSGSSSFSSTKSTATSATKPFIYSSSPAVDSSGTVTSNGSLYDIEAEYTNNINLEGTIAVYKYVDKSVVTSSAYASYIKFALYDQTDKVYITLSKNSAGTEYSKSGTSSSAKYYSMLYHSSVSAYIFKVNGLDSTHKYQIIESVTSNSVYETSMNYYQVTDESKSYTRSWTAASGTTVSGVTITKSGYTTSTRYVYINNPKVSYNTLKIYKAVTGYASDGTTTKTLAWTSWANIQGIYTSDKGQAVSSTSEITGLKYYLMNSSGEYITLTTTNGYSYSYKGTTSSKSSATKISYISNMYISNGGAATITDLPDDTYYVYETYSGDASLSTTPSYYNLAAASTKTSGTTYSSSSGAKVTLSSNSTKSLTFTNTTTSTTGLYIYKYVKTGSTTQLLTSASYGTAWNQLRFYLTYQGSQIMLYDTSDSDNKAGSYTALGASWWGSGRTSDFSIVAEGADGSITYTRSSTTLTANCLMKLGSDGKIAVDWSNASIDATYAVLYLHEVYINPSTGKILSDTTVGTVSLADEVDATYNDGATSLGYTGLQNLADGGTTYGGSTVDTGLNLVQDAWMTYEVENYGPMSVQIIKKIYQSNYDEESEAYAYPTTVTATSTTYPEVIDSLRFYIQNTSNGYYYKVSETYDDDGAVNGYVLNGYSTTLTEDCYIQLTGDGKIQIDSAGSAASGYYFLTDSSIKIYEVFVDTDDVDAEYMNARYSTSYTTKTLTQTSSNVASVTFYNFETNRLLTIIKDIEGFEDYAETYAEDSEDEDAEEDEGTDDETDDNSDEDDGTTAETVEVVGTSAYYQAAIDNLKFYIADSDGNYLVFDDGEFVGTSAALTDDCYLQLEANGSLTVQYLPDDSGLVVYEVCDDDEVSALISTDESVSVGTLTQSHAYSLYYLQAYYYNTATITDTPKTGKISVQKTTDLSDDESVDLSGIEFVIEGTSDLGLDVYEVITTDENGYAESGDIYIGTYRISEVEETIPDGLSAGGLVTEDGLVTGNGYLLDSDGNYLYKDDGETFLTGDPAVTVTTGSTASYTYKNIGSKMNVTIQKMTDVMPDEMDDLSGIKFTISGTSYTGKTINQTLTTDADGKVTFEDIPSGVYNVVESDVPEAMASDYADCGIDGACEWTITLDDENNGAELTYDYWNYYTEINLFKYDGRDIGDNNNDPISGATFTVYVDADGDGEYDKNVDDEVVGTLVEDEDNPGYYSITGIDFGSYLVKETAVPEGDIRFSLDENYYPVTISASSTVVTVSNSDFGFEEPPETTTITLTKRIRVDEIDGSVWDAHRTPTFILELTNTDDNVTYRHSYEFTEEYIEANKFTEDGVEYVEMSYTWEEMYAAHYTATEVNTVRYTLEDIINISDTGTKVTLDKTEDNVNTRYAVNFVAVADSDNYATFYNVKNTYKDLSDNSIVVNDII